MTSGVLCSPSEKQGHLHAWRLHSFLQQCVATLMGNLMGKCLVSFLPLYFFPLYLVSISLGTSCAIPVHCDFSVHLQDNFSSLYLEIR